MGTQTPATQANDPDARKMKRSNLKNMMRAASLVWLVALTAAAGAPSPALAPGGQNSSLILSPSVEKPAAIGWSQRQAPAAEATKSVTTPMSASKNETEEGEASNDDGDLFANDTPQDDPQQPQQQQQLQNATANLLDSEREIALRSISKAPAAGSSEAHETSASANHMTVSSATSAPSFKQYIESVEKSINVIPDVAASENTNRASNVDLSGGRRFDGDKETNDDIAALMFAATGSKSSFASNPYINPNQLVDLSLINESPLGAERRSGNGARRGQRQRNSQRRSDNNDAGAIIVAGDGDNEQVISRDELQHLMNQNHERRSLVFNENTLAGGASEQQPRSSIKGKRGRSRKQQVLNQQEQQLQRRMSDADIVNQQLLLEQQQLQLAASAQRRSGSNGGGGGRNNKRRQSHRDGARADGRRASARRAPVHQESRKRTMKPYVNARQDSSRGASGNGDDIFDDEPSEPSDRRADDGADYGEDEGADDDTGRVPASASRQRGRNTGGRGGGGGGGNRGRARGNGRRAAAASRGNRQAAYRGEAGGRGGGESDGADSDSEEPQYDREETGSSYRDSSNDDGADSDEDSDSSNDTRTNSDPVSLDVAAAAANARAPSPDAANADDIQMNTAASAAEAPIGNDFGNDNDDEQRNQNIDYGSSNQMATQLRRRSAAAPLTDSQAADAQADEQAQRHNDDEAHNSIQNNQQDGMSTAAASNQLRDSPAALAPAASGHGHHEHYYEHREVPKKKAWKFGFKRGNHKHTSKCLLCDVLMTRK